MKHLSPLPIFLSLLSVTVNDAEANCLNLTTNEEIARCAERMRPASGAPVGKAPQGGGNARDEGSAWGVKGKGVYNKACALCHTTGVAGAPKLGDVRDWTPRLAQGMETVYRHAIKGFTGSSGLMPPRGGAQSLSDNEVKAAVDYMVGAVAPVTVRQNPQSFVSANSPPPPTTNVMKPRAQPQQNSDSQALKQALWSGLWGGAAVGLLFLVMSLVGKAVGWATESAAPKAIRAAKEGAKGVQATARDFADRNKVCPYCAEKIKKAAIVCKHCGREVA